MSRLGEDLGAVNDGRGPDVWLTSVHDLSRTWGEPGGRGIVLVHGGAAHSRWWDHIGPLLAAGRRVVALDLSGHGDSDRRESYTLDLWAREVLAVAADAGITAPPVVIGHSMGGFVTLRAAGLFGAAMEGAVVIDSPVRVITPEEAAAREKPRPAQGPADPAGLPGGAAAGRARHRDPGDDGGHV